MNKFFEFYSDIVDYIKTGHKDKFFPIDIVKRAKKDMPSWTPTRENLERLEMACSRRAPADLEVIEEFKKSARKDCEQDFEL